MADFKKIRMRLSAAVLLVVMACFCVGCGSTGDGTGSDQTDDDQTRTQTQEEQSDAGQVIDEHGTYDSKDDVALYLYTYGHLPDNYMTKKEARELGWDGGSVERYAPGMCIGGDYYGNYEGNLPDGDYHECDIDTLGENSRGPKRIVYDDEDIYYTDDHYNTFEQLYDKDGEL